MKTHFCCFCPKVKDEPAARVARKPAQVVASPAHALQAGEPRQGVAYAPGSLSSARPMFRLRPESEIVIPRHASEASLQDPPTPRPGPPRVTQSAPAYNFAHHARETLPAPRSRTPWTRMPELDGLCGEAVAEKFEERSFQTGALRTCEALNLDRRGLNDTTLPRIAAVLATEAPALEALSLRGNRFSDKAMGFLCGLRLEHLDLLSCGLVGTSLPMFDGRVRDLLVFSNELAQAAARE